MRKCTLCKKHKPDEEFCKDKRRKEGYSSWCRECFNRKAQEYRRTKTGVCKLIYKRQTRNSTIRNHPPPTYKKSWLVDQMLTHPSFNRLYKEWVDSGYNVILKPSIDRVDIAKPYTKDNIHLTTWEGNLINEHADWLKGVGSKRFRPVLQFDLDGNFIAEHKSIAIAARSIGKKQSNSNPISKVCNGKRMTGYGYKWRYA